MVQDIRDHIGLLLDQAMSSRDMQTARDLQVAFEAGSRAWVDGVRAAAQQRLQLKDPDRVQSSRTVVGRLELVGDDTVEQQLQRSRLTSRIQDQAGQEFLHLRLRLLHVEQRHELRTGDLVRPEVLAEIILDEWLHAGLDRQIWTQLHDVPSNSLAKHLTAAYQETNQFLIANGVMKVIDFSAAVRRASTSSGSSAGVGASPAASSASGVETPTPQAGGVPGPGAFHPAGGPPGPHSGDHTGHNLGWWTRARQQTLDVMGRIRELFQQQVPPETGPLHPVDGGAAMVAGPMTRMAAPLHASESAVPPAAGPNRPVSATLRAMLDDVPTMRVAQFESQATDLAEPGMSISPADLDRYVQAMRHQSNRLKKAADTPNEKATIEVVALMFQSILTEERLKPSLRVWFARLQMPVLRVALAEPEFFSSLQHPARRLIDRMGSCALGFDDSLADDSGQALEAEIRRVVQIIEQYPETGRRVFQLAHDEFQKFLTSHLQSRGHTSELVSVAQQVEQKETRAIQYTIELRKQLDQMPVREGIRDFLFKVWAEVLAVASVKHDPKHPVMATLKQTASDLLWAASAKPSRSERSQVIAQLPQLLARLRQGMSMLGMAPEVQETHIKTISDILADAFMSRTESIPPEQLAEVTHNLSCLEDFLPSDGAAAGDLELDQDSIELITGVDASNITLITHGGQEPGEAVRAWAMELQLGAWFTLDHNGHVTPVQLAWRSDRGQLCLFASPQHQLYLMQVARVASYLQTGLLVPAESESLTVRATRAALEKLDANPERLLA